MPSTPLSRRVAITQAVLLGSLVLLHGVASRGARVSPHPPLSEVPLKLSSWEGNEQRIEPRLVEAAGVDDYLSRVYTDAHGNRIDLYIGYYEGQRTGDLIHSPKNCLPGTGWEPVRTRRLIVNMPQGSRIVVNEYLVEKGLDHQLVLYWYQARGRVIASEYWGKVWMVFDSISRNRTDGALVRVSTPTRDGEVAARARAMEFVRMIYPRLTELIPG